MGLVGRLGILGRLYFRFIIMVYGYVTNEGHDLQLHLFGYSCKMQDLLVQSRKYD